MKTDYPAASTGEPNCFPSDFVCGDSGNVVDEMEVQVSDDMLEYHYPMVETALDEDNDSLAGKDSLALCEHSLPEHAQFVDRGDEKNEANRRRRWLMRGCLIGALILLIVLATTLTRRGKNEQSRSVPTDGTALQDNIFTDPSPAPTSSLELTYAFQVLKPKVDDPSLLVDPSTPQGKAFAQIVAEDHTDASRLEQRFALMAFFFSTGGDSTWDFNNNWLNEDECSWHGVATCRRNQNDRNGAPTVAELDMGGNNMTGTFPSEICLLTGLEIVTVDQNQLDGELPACLTALSSLKELDTSGNNFSGELPSGLLEMPSIETLNLSNNAFSGTLEVLFDNLVGGVPAFQNLLTLQLDNNAFEGDIPSAFSYLTNMQTLTLEGNPLLWGVVNLVCSSISNLQLSVDCGQVECICCNPSCS